MEYLYGWVFFYNPFNEVWIATQDENLSEVKNDYFSEKAIRSKEYSTLISMIYKGEGNLQLIKAIAV